MHRSLYGLALACVLALPAWAQTQVWSEAPKTQRWSEAPAPSTPPPASTGTAPGRTQQWAAPTYTERRSDADIQRQVDAIARDAERGARAGRGYWNGGQGSAQVPDQAWREHMQRSRAQDQFQREQDEHYRRQREFNPR